MAKNVQFYRPLKLRCWSCAWFFSEAFEENRIEAAGECHKACPSSDGFPHISGSNWCGDHKISEAFISGELKDERPGHQ